jgi:hypothetical protein
LGFRKGFLSFEKARLGELMIEGTGVGGEVGVLLRERGFVLLLYVADDDELDNERVGDDEGEFEFEFDGTGDGGAFGMDIVWLALKDEALITSRGFSRVSVES